VLLVDGSCETRTHKAVTDVTEVFIEPVPRTDPELRAAVLARYGDTPTLG